MSLLEMLGTAILIGVLLITSGLCIWRDRTNKAFWNPQENNYVVRIDHKSGGLRIKSPLHFKVKAISSGVFYFVIENYRQEAKQGIGGFYLAEVEIAHNIPFRVYCGRKPIGITVYLESEYEAEYVSYIRNGSLRMGAFLVALGGAIIVSMTLIQLVSFLM